MGCRTGNFAFGNGSSERQAFFICYVPWRKRRRDALGIETERTISRQAAELQRNRKEIRKTNIVRKKLLSGFAEQALLLCGKRRRNVSNIKSDRTISRQAAELQRNRQEIRRRTPCVRISLAALRNRLCTFAGNAGEMIYVSKANARSRVKPQNPPKNKNTTAFGINS
jgi:hypothetical protein